MRRDNGAFWVLLFILLTVLTSSLTAICASAKERPNISAKSAVLYEPISGRFLYSENGKTPLPMASTTKIMTALVAAERLSADETVTVTREAVGTEGSSAYFKEGEELSAKDMLYALLLRSANDAAVALAVHISGSTEGFALLMNEKADELGLHDTNFTNPHGLHDPLHYTTAEELAKISAAALENPLVREISATKRAKITSSLGEKIFVNHNKLLHLYDGAVGVKTGFTKNAGRCLVGAAERDGVLLISVTLDAPTDWRDHERLLDLGFSLTESRILARSGDFEYTLPVEGGKTAELKLALKDDVRAVLLCDDGEVKCDVHLPAGLRAPIKKGDILGEAVFTLEGKTVARGELSTLSDCEPAPRAGFITRIKNFFKNKH